MSRISFFLEEDEVLFFVLKKFKWRRGSQEGEVLQEFFFQGERALQ